MGHRAFLQTRRNIEFAAGDGRRTMLNEPLPANRKGTVIMRRTPIHSRLAARPRLVIAVLIAATAALGSPAIAQELTPNDRAREREKANELSPERKALLERFERRLERIDALKDRGVAGETWKGYLEALDERLLSNDDRALLDDENDDRRSLYALVSEDRAAQGKKVPVHVIAERNGSKKFDAASAEQYIKIDEGRWIQKRDRPRAERIARLKKEGLVGETWEGWLEAIRADADREVNSIIEQENRDRRAMYDEIAGRIQKVNASAIARDAADSIRENLHPGEYFKPKDGDWEKRSSARG